MSARLIERRTRASAGTSSGDGLEVADQQDRAVLDVVAFEHVLGELHRRRDRACRRGRRPTTGSRRRPASTGVSIRTSGLSSDGGRPRRQQLVRHVGEDDEPDRRVGGDQALQRPADERPTCRPRSRATGRRRRRPSPPQQAAVARIEATRGRDRGGEQHDRGRRDAPAEHGRPRGRAAQRARVAAVDRADGATRAEHGPPPQPQPPRPPRLPSAGARPRAGAAPPRGSPARGRRAPASPRAAAASATTRARAPAGASPSSSPRSASTSATSSSERRWSAAPFGPAAVSSSSSACSSGVTRTPAPRSAPARAPPRAAASRRTRARRRRGRGRAPRRAAGAIRTPGEARYDGSGTVTRSPRHGLGRTVRSLGAIASVDDQARPEHVDRGLARRAASRAR